MEKYINILKKVDLKEEVYSSSNLKSEQEKLELAPYLTDKYDKGEYRIVTEQARYPIKILETLFDSNALHPDFQRHRVWSDEKKSRLIESFIMNVPIPPVFLYEVEYDKYEVMDGLQRISTIIDFYNDKFRLKNLDIWPELNGFNYSELPNDIKQGIDRRNLSAVILLKETTRDKTKEYELKRFVFDRLNSGGTKLENQELRNAIYSGEFNDMIKNLSENHKMFNIMWGEFSLKEKQRMDNYELVLRFFAYLSATKLNITKTTKDILDEYAKLSMQFTKDDITNLEYFFSEVMELTYNIFGESAFKSEINKSKSEKMIFDAVTLSISRLIIDYNYSSKNIYKRLDKEKFEVISKNQDAFNGKYTSIQNVNNRIDIITKMILEKNNEF